MAGAARRAIPTSGSTWSASSSRTRRRTRSRCSTRSIRSTGRRWSTALAKAMAKTGRRPDCFVQVNIGDEPQKGGCAVAELPGLLERRARPACRSPA